MSSALGLADFLGRISAGRDGIPISIDEAQEITGLNRGAVLERFRKLQSEGEGYLRLGRHGHPTRFYFRSPSGVQAGVITRDEPRTPTALNGEARSPVAPAQPISATSQPAPEHGRASLIEHHYQLRSDLRLSIKLPADLTEREAGRLARFIETLPM